MGAAAVHLPAGAVHLAEHGELLRLLRQPAAALAEGGHRGDPCVGRGRDRGCRSRPAARCEGDGAVVGGRRPAAVEWSGARLE